MTTAAVARKGSESKMPKAARKHPSLTPAAFEATILKTAQQAAQQEVFQIRAQIFWQLSAVELMLQAYMNEIKYGSRAKGLAQVNGRVFY